MSAAEHWTAWVTTDPAMLSGNCDVLVLRDRDRSDTADPPDWAAAGEQPVFIATTTVPTGGDLTGLQEEAETLLRDGCWLLVGAWESVPTGGIVAVEPDLPRLIHYRAYGSAAILPWCRREGVSSHRDNEVTCPWCTELILAEEALLRSME